MDCQGFASIRTPSVALARGYISKSCPKLINEYREEMGLAPPLVVGVFLPMFESLLF